MDLLVDQQLHGEGNSNDNPTKVAEITGFDKYMLKRCQHVKHNIKLLLSKNTYKKPTVLRNQNFSYKITSGTK